MTRTICFDTETTGFNYQSGDRIIEIGAVELIDGKITDKTFHEYINPGGKIIPPDSYRVHKLSNAFLNDKPLFAAIAPAFREFIGDDPVVAHNGLGFDFPFINWELRAAGLAEIPRSQQVDSMIVAQGKIYNIPKYTLDALAKWFNISLATRADSHGALIDAEILAKVWLELSAAADQKTIAEIAAEQHAAFLAAPKSDGNFPRREFPVSAEQIAAHREWVAKEIKDSLWLAD
ncbi:MAG: ribonuclease H-like domain-containing protein [Rickettsiales bacterium]|jgi:DNA polymerase-3 subunit epsilon|nr:ribonuclease H-like domain-containing protein [Rickettsiales bacterium]